MELGLNIDFYKNPLDCQDLDWLMLIWRLSGETGGSECKIDMDSIPATYKETMVYKNFYERLTYYRDEKALISDFQEIDDGKEYNIRLSDGFLDAVNRLIKIDFSGYGYELLQPHNTTDFLSQKTSQELRVKLDEILSVLDEELQLSKEDAANIAEAKTIIAEIQEELKSKSAKKHPIREKINTVLSAVGTCNQIKEFVEFVTPLLVTLIQRLQ